MQLMEHLVKNTNTDHLQSNRCIWDIQSRTWLHMKIDQFYYMNYNSINKIW